ncbi:AAA domain-containing protein [Thermodesulfitimonas autotrophica]|uniref:AAA domain-containing protein n=1 Tax=Thermodesulfitimonas autotrophica TaxID=1894989 RepID=A0A3N5C0E0_9THEO|nr:ATP-binding protein [Thermodesulfitimonas autotrophica]RPF49621.1 AAA domain-containing protein [Thermodesulfitimonas autotrophica]
MRIAITGAHGTGKTTLARALSEELGLPLITERARLVARQMEVKTCEELFRNPDLAREFQERVLEEQIRAQLAHPQGFVSDRCTLDCIAYWNLYLGDEGAERYFFKARLHAYRRLDLIVYVPPLVLSGGDGFRLGEHHAEVDACIRRELSLLRGAKVLGLEGVAPGERLAHVLEFVRSRKFSAGS